MIAISREKRASTVPRATNRGALYSLTSSCVAGLTGAVSGVLVARALGPTDRGLVASLTVVPFLVMTIASVGLDDAVARAVGNRSLSSVAARRLVWSWGLGWGLLVAVMLWPIQAFVVLDGRETAETTLIVCLAPAFIVTRLLNGITLGEGRYLAWNLLRTAGGLTYTVAIAVAFQAGHLSVLDTALAWVAAYCVGMALSAAVVRKDPNAPNARMPKKVLFPILRFGMQVGSTKVGSQLSQRVDQVILAFMVPLEDLGTYAVGATIALSPGVVVIGYSSYVFAAITRTPDTMRRLHARRFAIKGWIISMAIYSCVWLAAPHILRFGFGADFMSAAAITRWLCVGAAIYYGTLVSVSILNANELAARATKAQLVCLTISVALMPPAIALWGMAGAAYTAILANLVNAVLVAWAILEFADKSRNANIKIEVLH